MQHTADRQIRFFYLQYPTIEHGQIASGNNVVIQCHETTMDIFVYYVLRRYAIIVYKKSLFRNAATSWVIIRFRTIALSYLPLQSIYGRLVVIVGRACFEKNLYCSEWIYS